MAETVTGGSVSQQGGILPSQMAESEAVAEVEPGVAFPSDVLTDADRERWRNARRVAGEMLGQTNTPAHAATTRVLYNDRETYPD